VQSKVSSAVATGAVGAVHSILGDFKFVELLKTERTFSHKTNDASVSKIDYKL